MHTSKYERIDRSKFLIGTYYFRPYAHTKEHVKQLFDANVDFIVGEEYNTELMDLLTEYNIGIFPVGVLPQQRKLFHLDDQIAVCNYKQAAENYVDHCAVYGPFVGWRANMLNFAHYGELIKAAKELFPGQMPFFSLCSSYPEDINEGERAPITIHGTFSYEEYIDSYAKNIELDYICYEHYLYVSSPTHAFENLELVADKCRETNRDLWVTLQVNNRNPSFYAGDIVTENMMRFQSYTAMAFGAKAIIWSCWTKGWWVGNVLDENGVPTKQYKKICNINRELKEMSKDYIEYSNQSTHFLGFVGTPYLSRTKKQGENDISLGDFNDIHIDGGSAVVGYFTKEDSQAIMIADSSDPYDDGFVSAEISFKTDKKVSAICNGRQIEVEIRDGRYIITLTGSCGVFVTIK